MLGFNVTFTDECHCTGVYFHTKSVFLLLITIFITHATNEFTFGISTNCCSFSLCNVCRLLIFCKLRMVMSIRLPTFWCYLIYFLWLWTWLYFRLLLHSTVTLVCRFYILFGQYKFRTFLYKGWSKIQRKFKDTVLAEALLEKISF